MKKLLFLVLCSLLNSVFASEYRSGSEYASAEHARRQQEALERHQAFERHQRAMRAGSEYRRWEPFRAPSDSRVPSPPAYKAPSIFETKIPKGSEYGIYYGLPSAFEYRHKKPSTTPARDPEAEAIGAAGSEFE